MEEITKYLHNESLENLQTLTSILKNIKSFPTEERFKTLKKSNTKISKFLNQNIMYILQHVGFKEEKDVLIFKSSSLTNLEETLWIVGKIINNFEQISSNIEKKEDPLLNSLIVKLGLSENDAYYQVGHYYQKGGIVEKNIPKAIEYFEKGAERGNTECKVHLGYIYKNGVDTPINMEKSIYWFEQAAKENSVNAISNLAVIYHNAVNGIEKDFKKSFYWFEKGSLLGDASCQCFLGKMLYFGTGIKQDKERAFELFKNSSEKMFPEGLYLLGNYYIHELNESEAAFQYFVKSAQLDNEIAQLNLGIWYRSGIYIKKDFNMSFYWTNLAAKKGNIKAFVNLGFLYFNGEGVDRNVKIALEYLQKGVEFEVTEAIEFLASSYFHGNVVEQSFKKSLELVKKYHHLKIPSCLFLLGVHYLFGYECQKDYYLAFEYLQEASQLGDINATAELGFCYYSGRGVQSNFYKGYVYTKKAAEAGVARAQFNLGISFILGRGVDQDFKTGLEWVESAWNNGYIFFHHQLSLDDLTKEQRQESFEHFKKSSEKGYPFSIIEMGICYKAGLYVEKDVKTSFEYFEKVKDFDDPFCLYNLGLFYKNGEYVAQDYGRALQYFERANLETESSTIKQKLSMDIIMCKKKLKSRAKIVRLIDK